MADNSADIQAKTESPKSVTEMLWPMPVELINEQMKELCPIVITTITNMKEHCDIVKC